MVFIQLLSVFLITFYLIDGGLTDRNYRYREFDDEIGKTIDLRLIFNSTSHFRLIDNLQEEFLHEHLNFMQHGIHSERLMELYDELQAPPDFMRLNLEDIPQPKIDLACWGCRIAAPTLFTYRRDMNMSDEQMANAAIDICVNARITTKHVCEGLIHMNLESLLFVVDNQPKLTANIFCSFAFHGSCGEIKEPEFLYTINVDPNYPPWNVSYYILN